jgi:hypothetical protein
LFSQPGGPANSCNREGFPVFSAFPAVEVMARPASVFQPLLYGLVVTAAQIALAVFLLAPQGPLSFRYSTLVQHDSYWFMNIVNRGYQTIVPPIDHKVMEVSNVAFFPAYPMIAGALRYGLRLNTSDALLLTAQAAAWGFWTYFFLFCQRWNLSPGLRFFGALLIVAHPAAFFLIAGYSESLFLMALLGFAYWSTETGRAAKGWAALHGILMSATRIVGIPCAAFPVMRRIFAEKWDIVRKPRLWWRHYGAAVVLTLVSTAGGTLFFLYCQLRWGHWNLYLLTQSECWGIEPDYLAVFKPSSYRWLIPPLNDPTEMSQMAMTVGALLVLAALLCEMVPRIRRCAQRPTRMGIYFCAAVIYYVSVSGVASVKMESMLRYEFCVHALVVLAFLNFLSKLRVSSLWLRSLAVAAVVLASAAGLALQGWYVWNFTRGNWVA